MRKLFQISFFILFLISALFIPAQNCFSAIKEVSSDQDQTTSEVDLPKSCDEIFSGTQQCPQDLCRLQCVPWKNKPNICIMQCLPKPCIEIDAAICPLSRCEILKGCGGVDVCYYRVKKDALHCGRIGYVGQEVDCCEGMVRRCGIEFFDHTCDMTGENSIYSIPACIPCGNGICNQFENACNCPEDCSGGKYKGVTFDDKIEGDEDKSKKDSKKGRK